MLDKMGQRYGMLPSEVVKRASTFDMVIMDISLTIERHHQEKNSAGYVPPVSEEELLRIKEQANG